MMMMMETAGTSQFPYLINFYKLWGILIKAGLAYLYKDFTNRISINIDSNKQILKNNIADSRNGIHVHSVSEH